MLLLLMNMTVGVNLTMRSDESNLKKRREQLEQASQVCFEKIDLYQQVEEALLMLVPSLYFINHEGRPNNRQTVKTIF